MSASLYTTSAARAGGSRLRTRSYYEDGGKGDAAIERIAPRSSGHPGDAPRHIAETRQYLRDFNRLAEATTTARELYDAMLTLHPDRANPGSLWSGAQAAKK